MAGGENMHLKGSERNVVLKKQKRSKKLFMTFMDIALGVYEFYLFVWSACKRALIQIDRGKWTIFYLNYLTISNYFSFPI